MIRIMTDGVIPNTDNKKYIIDTASELSQLEAVFGNEAYCIADENTYICNGSGVYVEKKNVGENELPYVTSDDNGTLLEVGGGTWGKGTNVNDLARIDGYYEGMGVGEADQISATVGITDHEVYGFRSTGGAADVGNRENIKRIIGGSIIWNQLIVNGNFASSAGWSANAATLSVASNKATLTMPSEPRSSAYLQKQNSTDLLKKDHKYLISAYLTSSTDTKMRLWCCGNSSEDKSIVAGQRTYCSAVLTKGTAAGGIIIYVNRALKLAENDTVVIENVQCFDLTAMFAYCENIALNDFRRLFPKEYYADNSGTVLSVQTSAHKTVGFNLLAPNSTAKLIGGMATQITGSYTSVTYTTIDGAQETLTLDADGIFTPQSNGTLTVGGASTDTCVHLVQSGYRNGDYEEYAEHTNSFATNLELRGVMRLDSAERPYYDGDIYTPNGQVLRKYREIVLDGTTSGRKIPGNSQVLPTSSGYYAYVPLDVYGVNTAAGGGLIADKFITKVSNASNCIYITTNGHNLVMVDPVGDLDTAAKWNEWLSNNNVTVVYEVASPTVEAVDGYAIGMTCDDFGTEEFVDNRATPMPVGHETWYPANLRDKLQHLPDMASADGDYVIHQQGTTMVLKPYSDHDDLSSMFIVEVYEDGYGNVVGDKTCAEMWEALESGKRIYLNISLPSYFSGWIYEMPVTLFGKYDDESPEYWYECQIVNPNVPDITVLFCYGMSDEVYWNFDAYPLNGSPSGGDTLYCHYITFYKQSYRIRMQIINKTSTAFTIDSIKSYLSSNGFDNNYAAIPATGIVSSSSAYRTVTGVYCSNVLYADFIDFTNGREGGYAFEYDNFAISDWVVEV